MAKKLLLIMIGESNSASYVPNSQIPTENRSNELGIRDTVAIVNNASLIMETLNIGVNNQLDEYNILSVPAHGWELGLANIVESNGISGYNEFTLVKAGQGSARIRQFLPTSLGVNGLVETNFWNKFANRYNVAKNDIISQGDTPDVFILFSQGINDALAWFGGYGGDVSPSVWKLEVQAFISRVRTLVGYNCPVLMTKFDSYYDSFTNVSIDSIVSETSNVTAISNTGLMKYDSWHWDYVSSKILASRFVDTINTYINSRVPNTNSVKHALAMIYKDNNWGLETIMWSDGSYHTGYYFNQPVSPVPAQNLTVTTWAKFKALADKWAAKGGKTMTMPLEWDWTQIGENTFEFRQYIWALEYARTKGLTIGFWLLPFRRYGFADGVYYPNASSTTTWSYENADREVDANGTYWGDSFYQCLALGSPKWANVYKWISKVAEVLAPYSDVIESITIGTNHTYETSSDMGAINANHPDTIAKWQAWYLITYGTVAPLMATREENPSINKVRTAKFMAYVYKEINDTALAIVKSKMPTTKYIWHGGSMTSETFLRGCFNTMVNLDNYDGIKHNPGGDWDAKFETSSIYKPNKITFIEWTRTTDLANSASAFAQKIMQSIDAGATEISYSFFDTIATDSTVETFTDQVISILTQNGYWTNKQIVTPTGNSDVINFRTSEVSAVANNKYLDYRSVYTNAYNTSVSSHSGNPPTIIWVDDTEMGRPKTATPTLAKIYLLNGERNYTNGVDFGISIRPQLGSLSVLRNIEIYKDNILFNTIANATETVLDRYPLENAMYKIRVQDQYKVWSDFSNAVTITNTALPSCNPTGRAFVVANVSYDAVTKDLHYQLDAENCTEATWEIRTTAGVLVQSQSVIHTNNTITVRLTEPIPNGNYIFNLIGNSCQGTAVLGFLVTGSTINTTTIHVSSNFDTVCGEGKVCQFGYSSSQTILPIMWDDATSIKRLQITNGVVTEVSAGGNLYQTKSYDLTAGTYHFFVKEEGAGEGSIIYLGSKIVQ